ncbi:hypothetical protein [Streptomyces sp. IBSBF 2435]|uniref:hypothetical protein n=1 Tax=Streptomyces sp. IBSBF 2435 TaxID=2903531 RepID=UPI002FDBF508
MRSEYVPFHFSFADPSPEALARVRAVPRGHLEDEKDYYILALVACGVLDGTDAAFRIRGFGRDDWAFDVGYDMSAFVEELPRLINALRSGREVELDLYSQGVERTLTFSPDGDRVLIRCVSRASWVPQPEVEVCDAGDLLGMCVRLAHDFAGAVSAVAPAIARLEPFERWRRGKV